jgi:hypothetical protein
VLYSSQDSRPTLLLDVMEFLRQRFASLNRHYQAAWTDSFVHFRCYHKHAELLDAAKCAASQGIPGWYCFAVEFDSPRELTEAEDAEVRTFRFHTH